jgi:biopolymer transport protein ExbD
MRWRSGSDWAERADPNLTPLLDVVLQLITFFMVLVYFGTSLEEARRDVRLPVVAAPATREDLGLERLPVAVDVEGRLLAGEREAPLMGNEAEAWWLRKAAELGELQAGLSGAREGMGLRTVVVVQADAEARYGAVRRVLRGAQAAGFERFSLIVKRDLGATR